LGRVGIVRNGAVGREMQTNKALGKGTSEGGGSCTKGEKGSGDILTPEI